VDALPIVVAFDISEQVASGFVPGRPSSLVDEFHLQGVEEAFHRRIVVATPSASLSTKLRLVEPQAGAQRQLT